MMSVDANAVDAASAVGSMQWMLPMGLAVVAGKGVVQHMKGSSTGWLMCAFVMGVRDV